MKKEKNMLFISQVSEWEEYRDSGTGLNLLLMSVHYDHTRAKRKCKTRGEVEDRLVRRNE